MAMSPITIESKSQDILKSNLISIEKNFTELYNASESGGSSFSGNYNDLTNKPTIPAAYTLPTATASALGGVKIDGITIVINNGVISAVSGGSGGENSAGLDGRVVTLESDVRSLNTRVQTLESGSGGGGSPSSINRATVFGLSLILG